MKLIGHKLTNFLIHNMTRVGQFSRNTTKVGQIVLTPPNRRRFAPSLSSKLIPSMAGLEPAISLSALCVSMCESVYVCACMGEMFFIDS